MTTLNDDPNFAQFKEHFTACLTEYLHNAEKCGEFLGHGGYNVYRLDNYLISLSATQIAVTHKEMSIYDSKDDSKCMRQSHAGNYA
ncbi:hypothetical protein LPJ61_006656, partial [Coemansia biformis]